MDLGNEEKFILRLLYKSRCYTPSSSYNSKKLWKIFSKKYKPTNDKYFKKAIKNLLNAGLIGQVSKKDIKYYIDKNKVEKLLKIGLSCKIN